MLFPLFDLKFTFLYRKANVVIGTCSNRNILNHIIRSKKNFDSKHGVVIATHLLPRSNSSRSASRSVSGRFEGPAWPERLALRGPHTCSITPSPPAQGIGLGRGSGGGLLRLFRRTAAGDKGDSPANAAQAGQGRGGWVHGR